VNVPCGLLNRENEGTMILPNSGNYSLGDTVSHSEDVNRQVIEQFPVYFPKCFIDLLAVFNDKIDQMLDSSVSMV
jgi:hypothetical protein